MVAWGSLLSNIGSGLDILGSASGLFGGGSSGPKAPSHSRMVKVDRANMRRAHEYQVEMAQNGVRWRVEDAKRAGIHPMYALGMNPVSSSVHAVGSGAPSGGYPGPDMGESLSAMGNSISRAVAAKQTTMERLQERLLSVQIEGQEIDNAKKLSDVALQSSSQLPPPLPMGASPRYIPLVNPDGTITNVTHPDAGDNEFLMGWDFLSKTMPDEFKVLTGRTFNRMKNFLRGDIKPRWKYSKKPYKM